MANVIQGSGFGQLFTPAPSTEQFGPIQQPQQFGPIQQPQVLGASTSSLGGGGGSVPFEEGPSGDDQKQEEKFINESFAPAISALDQFASSLQGNLPGQIAGVQAEGAALTEQTKAEEALRLGEFGQQEIEQTGETKAADSALRRQMSELMQGIQSKFGGTTGTGAFAGELLGREALRGLAENRRNLQSTIAKIGQARNQLKTQVQGLVTRIELDTKNAVQSLRDNLVERIGEINIARGELEARKGERKLDLLREFRDRRASIESRNAQLKQDLFLRAKEASGAFDKFEAEENEKFSTTLTSALSAGGILTDPSQSFSPAQLQSADVPAGFAGFQFPPPKGEEEAAEVSGLSFESL